MLQEQVLTPWYCSRVTYANRLKEETGQGLAEYIIIVILIAVIIILALRYFGGSITGQFENATRSVDLAREGGVSTEEKDITADRRSPTSDYRESTTQGDYPERAGDSTTKLSARNSFSGEIDDGSLESQVARLKEEGVGGDEEDPSRGIQVDWNTLGIIAFFIGAVGIFIVLRFGKTESSKKKKSKLGRKGTTQMSGTKGTKHSS